MIAYPEYEIVPRLEKEREKHFKRIVAGVHRVGWIMGAAI
jgi:hypothetical protein